MRAKHRSELALPLPPLNGATAAWLYDLCGQMQSALLRVHGEAMEAHWTATVPDQPIYGPLHPAPPKKR